MSSGPPLRGSADVGDLQCSTGRNGDQLKLAQALFSQGFGTRRECAALIVNEMVSIAGEVCDEPAREVETAGLVLTVRGEAWPFHAKALVLMHKPAGYECSLKPKNYPGVHSLLPPPLVARGVQAVGRLDVDTTGLLLLTDDGQLIHKLTSPKHHVPKEYEAGCAEPVDDRQVARLLEGVLLDGERSPVRAAACERVGERGVKLTLTEGKYHQVKRMLAAAGNHVVTLHRSAFGALVLPPELAPGQWRWLDGPEVLYPGSGTA